jgi:hypothetical protein
MYYTPADLLSGLALALLTPARKTNSLLGDIYYESERVLASYQASYRPEIGMHLSRFSLLDAGLCLASIYLYHISSMVYATYVYV